MSLWDRLRGRRDKQERPSRSEGKRPGKPVVVPEEPESEAQETPEPAPARAGDPSMEHARDLVEALHQEMKDTGHQYSLKDSPAADAVTGLKPPDTRMIVLALLEQIQQMEANPPTHSMEANPPTHSDEAAYYHRMRRDELRALYAQLTRRNLPFEPEDLRVILYDDMSQELEWWGGAPLTGVKACEVYAKKNELPEGIKALLLQWRQLLLDAAQRPERTKLRVRIEKLLDLPPEARITPGEAWANLAIADLEQMDKETHAAWSELLDGAGLVKGARPTARWIKAVKPMLEKVGASAFSQRVQPWFFAVDKRPPTALARGDEDEPDPNLTINEHSADLIKGLVWTCSLIEEEDRDLARAIGALGLSAYRRVPGVGPRAPKIGNACVNVLGEMPGMVPIGQLGTIKMKIKYKPAQKGIVQAMEKAAKRVGLSPDELEEMGVPAYGLTEVGLGLEPMGDFVAEVTVPDGRTPVLLWRKPDGEGGFKIQKTIPKAVKEGHADALKEVRASLKDIKNTLAAQRERIDAMFLLKRSWDYTPWRERYLDHPLVGIVGRRLIWRFEQGDEVRSGVYLDGALVGPDDTPLEGLGEGTNVSLWHPVSEAPEHVAAWRDWFVRHEITQPFKQAYREVYLLTDAERQTRIYSNRYAAHIIKQHQFNALCAIRGWDAQLMLMVDDEFAPPHRALDAWDLRAEFWVEGVGEDYGTDATEAGSYLRLATDQVRFYRIDSDLRSTHGYGGGSRHQAGPDPLQLSDIPPLVFSEVMRDVDLFVSVASIGNDPTWADGGEDGRHRDYWVSYAFGELSGTAETRRAVLKNLVPQLKIADRCKFDGRFLVVRGDLRTYKIHMGSGNILMEPNDEYLCIVPMSSVVNRDRDKVFLPFDGDRTLSIVLSKALMLANDKKIKDRTILSQIHR